MEENYQALKELSIGEGMSLFGVADITSIKQYFNIEPPYILNTLQFGISIGYRLSDNIIEGLIDGPTKIYSMHYRRINTLLDLTALKITAYIQQKGFCALPIPASQIIDWQKEIGHLSHKMVARYAGLGWIGRNNLLINSLFGSKVRYATILTNLPLTADSPIDGNCKGCAECINVCPVGAIKESADDFDYGACSMQLKRYSGMPGIGQGICGLCVKICNPNLKKRW